MLLEDKVLSGEAEYDLIMVDAFTDDAIPSHLLTIEAFLQAYEPLLSEKGIIAFHVSNKYLDLYPPIVGMAREAGYEAVSVKTIADTENELYQSTTWVLVSKPEGVGTLLKYKNTEEYNGRVIVWTDEKNSVMSVLSLDGSGGE